MDPNTSQNLHEILRLAKENNAMLHSMRRNAFLWGFVKFVFYVILFAAPIWFYMTYVSNTVDNLLNAVNRMEGTTSSAQSQFNGFQQALRQIEASLPSFMHPASTSPSK